MASNTSRPQIDSKVVRELADILKDTELTAIEVEKGELRIRVAREVTAAPAMIQAAAPAPVAAAPVAAPTVSRENGAGDPSRRAI